MSPEFIAIIAVGVTLLGFTFTLHLRLERRIDRAEDNTNRRIDRLEDMVQQRFSEVDARLRLVEQNHSHLAGELASIRELLHFQPVERQPVER